MVKAACHCTSIRLEIESLPTWVLDCNCTLCRRYGGLWAYYEPGQVRLVQGADDTDHYSWLDHDIGYHWCKRCGCVTHYTVLKANPPWIRAINVRMIPTLDPAKVQIWQIDNSHTGFFWTRDADQSRPGGQPKMAPPSRQDWR
jgi:hypothetical protein